MRRFEVGKSYRTRSIGDHDCIIDAEVIARAVNAHDALVSALTLAESELVTHYNRAGETSAAHALDTVRAALRAARGEA